MQCLGADIQKIRPGGTSCRGGKTQPAWLLRARVKNKRSREKKRVVHSSDHEAWAAAGQPAQPVQPSSLFRIGHRPGAGSYVSIREIYQLGWGHLQPTSKPELALSVFTSSRDEKEWERNIWNADPYFLAPEPRRIERIRVFYSWNYYKSAFDEELQV